jgi:hypothetical protein
MKSETLILLGLLGLGAYLIWQRSQAVATPAATPGSTPAPSPALSNLNITTPGPIETPIGTSYLLNVPVYQDATGKTALLYTQ